MNGISPAEPGSRTTDGEVAQIVRAAWWVLERSHFRTLKVRQVLQASRVSANAFYRRFPSKSLLLVALVEDEMARATARLSARMDAAPTPDARLRAWIDELVDIAYDEHRAARARMFLDPILFEEQPEEVDRLHRAITAPLEAVIAAGVADGVFRSENPAVEAKAAYHMLRGFTTDRLAGLLTLSRDEIAATVHSLMARALTP